MAKQTINTGTTANDGTGDTLRSAFGKTNSNFTEMYNQTSNSWVSPITSNLWNVVQTSGASYVNLGDLLRVSINATATYSNTNITDIVLTANVQANNILNSYWNNVDPYNDILDILSYTYINGNTYNWFGVDLLEGNKWIVYTDGTNETLSAGDPIDLSIAFMPAKKAWINFDNIVSDFRGAKLTYHARIDAAANGYTEIGEISCIKTSEGITAYDVAHTLTSNWQLNNQSDLNQNPEMYRLRTPLSPATYNGATRYHTPSILAANGNTLCYFTNTYPYGNLHIQWSGTVFGGKDW